MQTPKTKREKMREYHARLRKEAIRLLGGECANCGNSDYRVLQIDHIEIIKRKKKESTTHFLSRIVRGLEDLTNLQLLCANCHMLKTYEDRIKFSCFIAVSPSPV